MQINRAPGPQIQLRPAGYGTRSSVPGPQTRPQNLAPNHPQYSHPGIQYVSSSKVQVQPPKTAPGPQIFPRKAPGPEEVPSRVKRAYVKKAGGPAPLPPGMTISQNQVLKNTGNSGMKIMKNQVVRISMICYNIFSNCHLLNSKCNNVSSRLAGEHRLGNGLQLLNK